LMPLIISKLWLVSCCVWLAMQAVRRQSCCHNIFDSACCPMLFEAAAVAASTAYTQMLPPHPRAMAAVTPRGHRRVRHPDLWCRPRCVRVCDRTEEIKPSARMRTPRH
jgi:hypothetical protein